MKVDFFYVKITSPDGSIHPIMNYLPKESSKKIMDAALKQGYVEVNKKGNFGKEEKIFIKSIEEITEEEHDKLKGWSKEL